MNSQCYVKVNDLWKKYILQPETELNVKSKVINWFTQRKKNRVPVWVLQDVNFTVNTGETLGIIGENGVGKTTILKLIAGIIKPTRGTIELNGSVTSLLELGAGFHPELTGKENVYLNGAILGMNKARINSIYTEIVSFAELTPFMDLPVKLYSSGMYMRLAFSVAAFVDTDIILIDEALSVGDESFQRKCLLKLREMQRTGKAIIFVSHNLNLIAELCTRVLWLNRGKVELIGTPELVIDRYLNYVGNVDKDKEITVRSSLSTRWGTQEVAITDIKIFDVTSQEQTTFPVGTDIYLQFTYTAHQQVKEPVFALSIYREDGVHIFGTNTQINRIPIPYLEGKGIVKVKFENRLNSGKYFISLGVHDTEVKRVYDTYNRMYTFRVVNNTLPAVHGPVYLPCNWELFPDK